VCAKGHTEFFTVALVLLTFIFISLGRYYYAAVPIAIASTQNISLAVTAWTLIAIGALNNHLFRVRLQWRDILPAVIALCATALHPLYYLYRQGVITPQLKAGGASLGGNSDHLMAVLVDPDIGLLPNWWLGILIIIVCVSLAARFRPRPNVAYCATAAVYLLSNLFAQASTTNLNSGSVDLSRYALWYIPLLYAPLAWALAKTPTRPTLLSATSMIALAAAPLIALNLSWYWPSRYERYTKPSFVSNFIQSSIPTAYDPPIEIFVERNSGYGEGSTPLGAIAGPGCRKLYVPAPLIGATSIRVISEHHCSFDPVLVASLVANAPKNKEESSKGLFIALDQQTFDALQRTIREGRVNFSADAEGSSMLQSGWSNPESWGTWSNASRSTIRLDLADCGERTLELTLSARGFAIAQNPKVSTTLILNGQVVGAVDFTQIDAGPRQVAFHYSCAGARSAGNVLNLELVTSGAATPASLGLGADNRLLGIGVEWLDVRYVRSPTH